MKQEYNISLSEYTGEVCLVLYHSPCLLNCNWCFNKKNLTNSLLKYDESVAIIEDNRDYITSVCLTGGEPFLSHDFNKICEYIKDDGLKLKVNTSGVVTPVVDTFSFDYVNISFKGGFGDYQRYGYIGSLESLKNNLNILSDNGFSKELEWSVVYHKLIIDLNKVKEFMCSLDYLPNYFTLNQLQVGDCIDSFINDFTIPSRDELIRQVKLFEDIPFNHLLVESKEYGREIIL